MESAAKMCTIIRTVAEFRPVYAGLRIYKGQVLHNISDCRTITLPSSNPEGLPYISLSEQIPSVSSEHNTIIVLSCLSGVSLSMYCKYKFKVGENVYYCLDGSLCKSVHSKYRFIKRIGIAMTDSDSNGYFMLRFNNE